MHHGILRLKTIIITMILCVLAAGARDFTVIIDAGHGGHDSGCVGKVAKEKNITLDVAKRLADRINKEMPGVKAILTRSDDRFLTLQQRADVANRNSGDLFISIHVNSVAKESAGRASVQGASVYTLGLDKSKNNLNVAMRENSVMELEKDYTRTYKGFDPSSAESYIIFELNQNAHLRQSLDFASKAQRHLVNDANRADKGVRQDGFWVLWATGMPSVLVELDFICNPRQEAFLNSAEGRGKCADALFNAVSEYRGKSNRADTNNRTADKTSAAQQSKTPAINVAAAFKK